MLTPEGKKRLSLLALNPYDAPSPVSPVFDLLTPVPYSPSPYSPAPSTPTSPPPVQLTQQPLSSSPPPMHWMNQLHPTEPAPRSTRSSKMRPKSYGGGLTPESLELILDFESRIAELESRHTMISVELEETRDALNSERAARRTSNRFSTLSLSRFSSISSSSDGGSDQNDADYERRLRDELQETLKKIRAQNALISRSLRQKEETCTSLSTALEEERSARKAAADEVARLTAANFTLLEHNKLLVGRDAALQEDISSLITKSQADEWMRGVLETELHRRSPPSPEHANEAFSAPQPRRPSLTLEHQGDLRAELVSARDELHITQVRLATSEKECAALTQRVSALQRELVMCLDSSSQALEVERELRADVEERFREMADEKDGLKTRLTLLEEVFPDGHAPEAWIKKRSSMSAKRRPVSGRLQKKLDSDVKIDTADRLLDRHRHVLTSKKIRDHKKRRQSLTKSTKRNVLPTPTAQNFRLSFNKVHPPDTPMSSESTCSTKVASPSPLFEPTSKRHKRMSVILAATLAKNNRPTWSALKTNSSLFVDVNNRLDEPMVQLETVMASPPRQPPKRARPRPQDLRTYMMQRASAIFVDLAHSYTSVDTVHESSDENLV
ncbi:hypothetical protein MSAN_00999300 [Mycena sanguinolenta]|uniref:Uncharacterized protein n=1 Tax=Mycena sanguinolenta TaxID=230812 RepID=A0A8H6YLS0_9AGAR|nr:hypothetical protein MSAN_00999300 [Mycena sanguinolenta]